LPGQEIIYVVLYQYVLDRMRQLLATFYGSGDTLATDTTSKKHLMGFILKPAFLNAVNTI